MKKFLTLTAVLTLVATTAFAGYNRNNYRGNHRHQQLAENYDQTRIFLYETPGDKTLMTAIQQQLEDSNFDLRANAIRISINDGIVTITGKLATQEANDTLKGTISNVPGVKSVIMNTSVNGSGSNGSFAPTLNGDKSLNQYNRNDRFNYQRPLTADATNAALSDDQLQAQIETVLMNKSFKQQFPNVSFQISNGAVILSGSVDSLRAKQKVENRVKEVAGTNEVQNMIEVESAQ